MGALVFALRLTLLMTLLIGLSHSQEQQQGKRAVPAVDVPKATDNNGSLTEQVVHTARDKNETAVSSSPGTFNFIPNTAAMLRSFYVFCGLGFLALLYFVIRTCRLRRRRGAARRTGTRKYLPLNAGGSGSQELEPLGQANEDDDEDTLFDTSQPSGNPTA